MPHRSHAQARYVFPPFLHRPCCPILSRPSLIVSLPQYSTFCSHSIPPCPSPSTPILPPGPGAYDIPSTIGTGPSKTIGQRLDRRAPGETVPPPGAYSVTAHTIGTSRRHQYTIGGRTKMFTPGADSPGPGAYDPRLSQKPGVTMSGRPKELTGTLSFPSPAQYTVTGEILSTRAPAYSLTGRPTDPPSKLNTPGPGAYDVLKRPRTDRVVSLKSRHSSKPETNTPGPGAYNLTSGPAGPKFTMGGRTPLPRGDD